MTLTTLFSEWVFGQPNAIGTPKLWKDFDQISVIFE
jgi:hypothetical protein